MKKKSWSEIYLIQEEMSGPIKIGRSASTENRLKTLQTGNPRALRVVQIYTLSADDAVEAEARLHSELGHSRLCGEWFDINEQFVTSYLPDFFRSAGLEFIEGELCGEPA
jgi:hypothetical protein